MADIPQGASVEVQGSGASRYTLEHKGDVYSCTCPAWRNQKLRIEERTCKHLRAYLGDEVEDARVGSGLPPRGVTAARRPRLTNERRPEDVERRAERRAALATALERFPAVAQKMTDVYGLRLPKHVAYAAGFFLGLSREERSDVDNWSGGGSMCGILEWFEAGGLSRRVREGLDERLQFRFRADPPEMVTVLGGNTDGLHWGLFYDDPAELPREVVHNYARDSAETWPSAPTILLMLKKRHDEESRDPHREEVEPATRKKRDVFLSWLEEVLPLELAAHREEAIPAPHARGTHLIGGMDPWVPGFALPAEMASYPASEMRSKAYRANAPEVQEWIARARAELADGKPGLALFYGRELHWFDHDDFRAACTELLTGAYRALGRDALAEIVLVHHRHRDLESVDVYEARAATPLEEALASGDAARITSVIESSAPDQQALVGALMTTSPAILDAVLAAPRACAAADEAVIWHFGQMAFWKDYPDELAAARTSILRILDRVGTRGRALERLLASNDDELVARAIASADLEWRSPHGRSVLHVAARAARPTAVTSLLDRGADPTVADSDGKTPYDAARDAWQELPREANEIFAILEARGGGPKKIEQPVDPSAWSTGAKVTHSKFGNGTVDAVSGTGDEAKLTIKFDAPNVGTKTLQAKFVRRL